MRKTSARLPEGAAVLLRGGSVARRGTVGANGLIGHIAGPPLHAVVDRDLADRAECFVVKGWNPKRGAKLFVKSTEILQVRSQRRKLEAIIGQQEFLVTRIPQAR